MTSRAGAWRGSDGWLLASLSGAPFHIGNRDELSQFIAYADMLNHAIVAYDELCDVLRRLAAQGVVVSDGGFVRVTSAAEANLAAVVRGSRNAMFAPDEVLGALRAGALDSQPASSPLLALPTREDFEAAAVAYTAAEDEP